MLVQFPHKGKFGYRQSRAVPVWVIENGEYVPFLWKPRNVSKALSKLIAGTEGPSPLPPSCSPDNAGRLQGLKLCVGARASLICLGLNIISIQSNV